MKFVVFSADGVPVRSGSCPDGQEAAQAREGETSVTWGNERPTDWRLVDGELVRA